jgi:hypothetical protein
VRLLPAIRLLTLAVASTAWATDPCSLVAESDQPISIALVVGDPEATLVAGAVIEIDHPEDKVGIEGEGIAVPKTTISKQPPDAIATANDLGDRVRVVIARAGQLPTNQALLTLHFERCRDAKAVVATDFTCKVVDASDPTSHKIQDVGCKVTIP